MAFRALLLSTALTALVSSPAESQTGDCPLQSTEETVRPAEALERAKEATDSAQKAAAYREVLQGAESLLRAGPDEPAYLLLAAVARVGLGHFELADSLLSHLLNVAPGCAEYAEDARRTGWVEMYNRGVRAYRAGHREEAIAAFEGASLIYRDARSLEMAAALHEERGDRETAIARLRQAVEAARNVDQRHSSTQRLAEALAAAGRPAEAVEVYAAELRKYPADAGVASRLAIALGKVGRLDSARAILTRFASRDDLTVAEWNQVGAGFFEIEAYPAAVRAFRMARQREPLNAEAMASLLDALVEMEEFRDAQALADTLVRWYPYDAFNYRALMRALSGSGQGAKALEVLQRAESLPFELSFVRLVECAQGRCVVEGEVTGRGSAAGQSVTIPFELLGEGGAVVGATDLKLMIPPAGESRAFRVEIPAESSEVMGFRYREARA